MSIHNDQYFPRIAVGFLNGNGYSSPLFYSNLIFYPLILFSKMPFSYLTYYKLLLLIYNFSGLVITYFCALRISKKKLISFFVAILYMTSIFYQYEMLVRNALGEGIAMAFLPMVVLGIYNLVYAKNHGWFVLTIAMTLLVYTHLITTALCGFGMLVYLMLHLKIICNKTAIFINLFKAAVVSFLLSAGFLLLKVV